MRLWTGRMIAEPWRSRYASRASIIGPPNRLWRQTYPARWVGLRVTLESSSGRGASTATASVASRQGLAPGSAFSGRLHIGGNLCAARGAQLASLVFALGEE